MRERLEREKTKGERESDKWASEKADAVRGRELKKGSQIKREEEREIETEVK